MKSWILLLGVSLTVTACSSAPKPRTLSTPAFALPANTEIAISYILGHNRYQFLAQCRDSRVTAQTLLDRKVLRSMDVSKEHYASLFQKAQAFVLMERPSWADNTALCRNPFEVKIKAQDEVHSIRGCRTAGDASFSHLVTESEILLYAKK